MVSSHTYGFDVAAEAFREACFELLTLTVYEHVIAVSSESCYVSAADLELLRQWRQNPAEWGK